MARERPATERPVAAPIIPCRRPLQRELLPAAGEPRNARQSAARYYGGDGGKAAEGELGVGVEMTSEVFQTSNV